MDTTKAQQKALDDALVAPENRLNIRKCNQCLSSTLKSNEPTIQVALDALKLTPVYNAFEVSTDVPEIYMQEFWATVTKHHFSLWFKLNGKSHTVNVDNFRDMLKIYPKLPGHKFEEPTFEEEILPHIRDLRHTGDIKEDFVFQVENKDSKKNNDMFYPRFTKVIVDYFMAKDPSISRRNKMFWHTARDDSMFTTISHKTYHAYATGEKTPKPKKKKADSESSPKDKPAGIYRFDETKEQKNETRRTNSALWDSRRLEISTKPAPALKGKRLKTSSKAAQSTKENQPTKSKVKGDGVDTLSKVPNEQPQKKSGTDEGASNKPEVPNVPKCNSDSEEESCTFSDGDDDDDVKEESDAHDDSDENESDDEGDDFFHPNLSTYMPDDQDEEENVEDEEKAKDDKDMSDQRMLYGDLNLNRERIDAGMTKAHATKDTEDANVNLTAVTPVVQQQSSSASDFVLKFINLSTDEGIDSVLNQNIQFDTLVDILVTTATETPSSDTTTLQSSTLNIHSLQTPVTTTSTTFPTTTLPEIPNIASLFSISSIPGIVDKYLATKMKEAVDVAVQLKSDKLREEAQAENQDFINSLDSNMTKIIKQQVKAQNYKIMSKVEKYVTETLSAEVLVRSTNQPQTSYENIYNALVKAYNTDKDIISTYGDVVIISRGHGDEDKDEEPSAGSNRGTKRRRSGKETESTNEPTHKESRTTSSSRGAPRSQPTDLDDSTHQEFNIGDKDVTPIREEQDERQWHPSSSPTPDHEWHLTKTVSNLPPQPWITHLAQAAGLQSSFDKLVATPIDFSAFMMNCLKIDYLTQELLTGPTYDLMKGSCKSVAELEYHLE
ncbi:hypothetical protein Tco_1506785 [Tanacetum coccineum]